MTTKPESPDSGASAWEVLRDSVAAELSDVPQVRDLPKHLDEDVWPTVERALVAIGTFYRDKYASAGDQAVAYCEPSNPNNSTAFAWPGTAREERHSMPLYIRAQGAAGKGVEVEANVEWQRLGQAVFNALDANGGKPTSHDILTAIVPFLSAPVQAVTYDMLNGVPIQPPPAHDRTSSSAKPAQVGQKYRPFTLADSRDLFNFALMAKGDDLERMLSALQSIGAAVPAQDGGV